MKNIFHILISLLFTISLTAQQVDIEQMTKEDVLNLNYDQLLDMPFEDVLKLADIVGVSMDELYELLLNKSVVSASKKEESSFEAPLSTSVISYDDIIASGARSVEEALRLVPGLIVREKTNGNFDVQIRGNENLPANHMLLYSENSNTLVMIDNRPVFNYVHGGTFWETLPVGISDIDRIEVVRGPSSALYGPNAVSGVVNIITKEHSGKELKVDANVQAGTQNTVIASLGVGKGLSDKLSMRITGNFETMDRNREELWVHTYNGVEQGWLTREELNSLTQIETHPATGEQTVISVFDPGDDIYDMYPNPKRARQRFGGNAYLNYKHNEDIYFALNGGYQASEVLSSTMGDNPTSFAGRVSNTGYANLTTKIHGLSLQANTNAGWQDIVKQDTGFKVDLLNINVNAEYDFQFGNLNIRPGVFYQLSKYNDMPYLSYDGQGFMNGETELSTTAASLRLDYVLLDKIRFIGAVRGEKYNTHDVMYLSYQFITSFNLNDKHYFRLVHSKANRGPFIVDSYANYTWVRDERPIPGQIKFQGQKNLDLLTMYMFEFGYRIKPAKNIQADFEAFLNFTDNYGALYPDSVNLDGYQNTPPTGRPYAQLSYTNIDLTARQMGITGNISWVATKNILLKVYGTYQKTMTNNAYPGSPDKATTEMLTNAFYLYGASGGAASSWNIFPEDRNGQEENLATPSFYGGFLLDIRMLNEKLTLSTNLYTYGKQTFSSKYSVKEIESKPILNVKLSYKLLSDQLSLFVNGRNLISDKLEFAYMDKIGALLLLGANFNF